MKDKLKQVILNINKKYGKHSIVLGTEVNKIDRIPLSSKIITEFLGGGIPIGMFTVIWGEKGVGKTTLALDIIKQAQKLNKSCIYYDLECSFDPDRAKDLGVDLDSLFVGRFNTAEETMNSLIELSNEKAIDVAIIDSIQAMSPKGEQEEKSGKLRSVEEDEMALLARKLSKFFRIVAPKVHKGNVAVVLIGQARTNLSGYVKLETLSGGHALKHWASLILKIRRGQKTDAPKEKNKVEYEDKDGKIRTVSKMEQVGFDCVIQIERAKISTAGESKEIHIPFYYKEGFKDE